MMRKFFTLIVCICSAMSVFAADYTTESDVVYLKPTNLQRGADGKIELVLKSEKVYGTINVEFSVPEGITINSVTSEGASVTYNKTEMNLLLGKGEPYYSAGTVATLNVTVAENAQLGENTVSITKMKIVEPNLTTIDLSDIASVINIQRTAIFTPMADGYALEVLPFAIEEGATSVNVQVSLTNAEMVDDIAFSLDLPSFMSPTNVSKKIGKKTYSYVATTNLDEDRIDNTESTFIITAEQDEETGLWSYSTLNNNGDAFLTSPNGSLAFTIPMTLTGSQAAGVYTIKMSDINVETVDSNYDAIETLTGESLSSSFLGTPTETDPILYGHYTSDIVYTLNDGVAKNFRSADITAATVDGTLALNDVLTYGKENTSYSRTVSGYGTVCLPFALTSGDGTNYYKLSSVDGDKLVFTHTETVEPNTPVLVKGDINASAEGYKLANTVNEYTGSGWTMKGTYETTTINGDYYLSGNKFYNDEATVKPFRAYLSSSSTAKELRVYIDDTTGLHEITNELYNEDIYNLQGMKMQHTQRGINIIGGKKVLIKK